MSSINPLTLLIRLWRADESNSISRSARTLSDTKARALRITALDPHTGERWGFATLPELLAFLQQQLETSEQ